jgi:hypothetical protein
MWAQASTALSRPDDKFADRGGVPVGTLQPRTLRALSRLEMVSLHKMYRGAVTLTFLGGQVLDRN